MSRASFLAALSLAGALAVLWGRAVPECGSLAPLLWSVAGLQLLALAAQALPSAFVGRLLLPSRLPPHPADLDALRSRAEAARAEKARSAVVLAEPLAEIPLQYIEAARRLEAEGDGAAAARVARAVRSMLRPDPSPGVALAAALAVAAAAALSYAGDARSCAAAASALALLALRLLPELGKASVMARERAVEEALGERLGGGALVRRSEVEGMRTAPVWAAYAAALDVMWAASRAGGGDDGGEAVARARALMAEVPATYSSVETSKELWSRAERRKRFGAAW